MLPRRLLLSWLFALTLLFGQATAFAHALTHLGASDPALPEPICEVCVAQAQLGSALPSATAAMAVAPFAPLPHPDAASCPVEPPPRPACARAPPATVHA
jgi:hypothetical protein